MSFGPIISPNRSSGRVLQEKDKVNLIIDGKRVALLPAKAAIAMGQALIQAGRLAEEWERKEGIMFDQALLRRVGANVGMLINPVLRKEADQIARKDPTLRKAFGPEIKQQGKMGIPHVRKVDKNGKD